MAASDSAALSVPVTQSSSAAAAAQIAVAAPFRARPAPARAWAWWRPLDRGSMSVCLAPVIPGTRLEIALCALFRCQCEWPLDALVARLALAPADSADGSVPYVPPGQQPAPRLGTTAARRAVHGWLRQGTLLTAR